MDKCTLYIYDRTFYITNEAPFIQSLSSNSCGVKKSAYLSIICKFMNTEQNLHWNCFGALKYILRNSNTVF